MQNFRNVELPDLIDLLERYVSKYSKLLGEGANEKEYWDCKQKIRVLQTEIEIKKNLKSSKALNDQENPIPKEQH